MAHSILPFRSWRATKLSPTVRALAGWSGFLRLWLLLLLNGLPRPCTIVLPRSPVYPLHLRRACSVFALFSSPNTLLAIHRFFFVCILRIDLSACTLVRFFSRRISRRCARHPLCMENYACDTTNRCGSICSSQQPRSYPGVELHNLFGFPLCLCHSHSFFDSPWRWSDTDACLRVLDLFRLGLLKI
jgi:hypothetical protein